MKLLAAVVVLAAAASARAQAPKHDKPGAAKVYAEGSALYSAGNFVGAADKFRLAYDRDPDPVYLYNLAQAERFAKQCQDAAEAYRHFLAAAPTAPNRDKVEHYIAEMDACARTEGLAEPANPQAEPVAPMPPPAEPPAASHPATEPLAQPFQPEPLHAEGHRRLTYGLAGVGVAALIAGGYFTYDLFDAKSKQSTCDVTPSPCDGKTIRDLDDRGSRDNIAVPVTLGIAGAALAASIVLFVHDRHAERAIAVAPTRGGALLTGILRF